MARTQPFDEHYQMYDDWFQQYRDVYRSEVEAVRHFIPQQKTGVEIGVGTGRFALPLGIATGVEPSLEMRKIARRRGIDVLDGVAEKLPLADRSFDFALMVTTICFVDDVVQSFQEARRILKPGGLLIIGLVDKASPLGRVYEEMKEQNEFYRLATFYSTDETVNLLEQAGFKDIEIVQTVFGDLNAIHEVQPFKLGYGEGGFVAVKAAKSD